jgi:maltose alpha-D-glucosyltransferase/alpha-amylase
MGDNLALKERDAVRTPMQWSANENADFSTARKLVHPVIDTGYYSFKHVNVEDQRRDPQSMLNWMTALIRLRKECPEIGLGEWQILDTKNEHILGMRYLHKDSRVITIHNFSDKPCEVVLPAKMVGGGHLTDLMKRDEIGPNEKDKYAIQLDAFGYRWFRVR